MRVLIGPVEGSIDEFERYHPAVRPSGSSRKQRLPRRYFVDSHRAAFFPSEKFWQTSGKTLKLFVFAQLLKGFGLQVKHLNSPQVGVIPPYFDRAELKNEYCVSDLLKGQNYVRPMKRISLQESDRLCNQDGLNQRGIYRNILTDLDLVGAFPSLTSEYLCEKKTTSGINSRSIIISFLFYAIRCKFKKILRAANLRIHYSAFKI